MKERGTMEIIWTHVYVHDFRGTGRFETVKRVLLDFPIANREKSSFYRTSNQDRMSVMFLDGQHPGCTFRFTVLGCEESALK